jgi:hypothetical protein
MRGFFMMYKVYAIANVNRNYIYVGLTSDLNASTDEKKLFEHKLRQPEKK